MKRSTSIVKKKRQRLSGRTSGKNCMNCKRPILWKRVSGGFIAWCSGCGCKKQFANVKEIAIMRVIQWGAERDDSRV